MVRKIGIIAQAHMGSTRLKNKMMLKICDKSVLEHIIFRLQQITAADEIIIATSNLKQDDVIVEKCEEHKVKYFRGSDTDVLERFYEAARKYKLTDVGRVCADNLLLDAKIIDHEIDVYMNNECEMVVPSDKVPLGLGCEIFPFNKLEEAAHKATKSYQREHVTPYLYETLKTIHKDDFDKDYAKYRFTLDTPEDFRLLSKIYDELYPYNPRFVLEDVITLMERNPSWYSINCHIKQRVANEQN